MAYSLQFLKVCFSPTTRANALKLIKEIKYIIVIIVLLILNKLSLNHNRHCEALKTPWQSRKEILMRSPWYF